MTEDDRIDPFKRPTTRTDPFKGRAKRPPTYGPWRGRGGSRGRAPWPPRCAPCPPARTGTPPSAPPATVHPRQHALRQYIPVSTPCDGASPSARPATPHFRQHALKQDMKLYAQRAPAPPPQARHKTGTSTSASSTTYSRHQHLLRPPTHARLVSLAVRTSMGGGGRQTHGHRLVSLAVRTSAGQPSSWYPGQPPAW
jgi:hypothetical protein